MFRLAPASISLRSATATIVAAAPVAKDQRFFEHLTSWSISRSGAGVPLCGFDVSSYGPPSLKSYLCPHTAESDAARILDPSLSSDTAQMPPPVVVVELNDYETSPRHVFRCVKGQARVVRFQPASTSEVTPT